MRKKSRKKYGSSDSRLYGVYSGNKNRCENPNNAQWHLGGGKGIKFKFKDYEHFRKWSIKNGYIPRETMLKRKNKNGDYTPRNCYWDNRRGEKVFEIDGVKMNSKKLSEKIGVCTTTILNRARKYGAESDELLCKPGDVLKIQNKVIYNGEERILKDLLDSNNVTVTAYYWRVNNGWSVEKAIDTPVSKRKMPKKFDRHIFEYKGEEVTIEEIADMIGIKEDTVRSRFYRGMSVEEVINTPLFTHTGGKIMFDYKGEKLSTRKLSEKTGLSESLIRTRHARGMTTDEIVNTPLHTHFKKNK